jgi:hypothetical protein
VIGLGDFYTVLDDLSCFPIQDDAVLCYGDLIYYCGFSDCSFVLLLFKSPSASSEADKLSDNVMTVNNQL